VGASRKQGVAVAEEVAVEIRLGVDVVPVVSHDGRIDGIVAFYVGAHRRVLKTCKDTRKVHDLLVAIRWHGVALLVKLQGAVWH